MVIQREPEELQNKVRSLDSSPINFNLRQTSRKASMANIFLISDTHFSHENILTFYKSDGSKLRDFDSVQEMDETMVQNWNRVVKPLDRIYHLGDVAISHKALPIFSRLNGRKVLIKGNHDQAKLSQYLPYFDDIRAYHQLDKMLLTHVPVHSESLSRWTHNIHGHTHSNVVGGSTPDLRYIPVCVEQPWMNYTPISLEELKVVIEKRT